MQLTDHLLTEAWQRVRPSLDAEPAALRKRLERGRRLLQRPPREWCVVVRANDRRINPATAAMVPEDAAYPRDHVDRSRVPDARGRHEVTVTGRLLRKLCRPIWVEAPGETPAEVGRKLGVTHCGMLWSRLKGVFRTRHIQGLGGVRGNPVPLIYTDKPLDASRPLFAMSDPAWGWTALELFARVPEEFGQTLVRVPCIWPRGRKFRDKDDLHPEHPDVDVSAKRHPSRALQKPEPDYVWYKFKDGEYVGYDWRSPSGKERYEREMRQKEQRRERERRRGTRRGSASRGSMEFRGWRWICPRCERAVKMLYLPLPVSVLDEDLAWAAIDAAPPAQFACEHCHRVRRFSRTHRMFWNELVGYLSGGLLYGTEVERPAWLTSERKRAFMPRLAPERLRERREELARRLMEGWSYAQIARELGVTYSTIVGRVNRLYVQHGVSGGRRALARKLGMQLPARQSA